MQPTSGCAVPYGRLTDPSDSQKPAKLNPASELHCLQVEYLDTAVSGLLASRLTVVESKVQEISRR